MIVQSPIPTRGFMWTVTMETPNNTSVRRITPRVRWSCLFQSFPPWLVSCINSCVYQSLTLWVVCGHSVFSVAHHFPSLFTPLLSLSLSRYIHLSLLHLTPLNCFYFSLPLSLSIIPTLSLASLSHSLLSCAPLDYAPPPNITTYKINIESLCEKS